MPRVSILINSPIRVELLLHLPNWKSIQLAHCRAGKPSACTIDSAKNWCDLPWLQYSKDANFRLVLSHIIKLKYKLQICWRYRTGWKYWASGLSECSAVRIKIYVADGSEDAQTTSTSVYNIDEIGVCRIQPLFRIFQVRRLERWSSRIKSGNSTEFPRQIITSISGYVGA